MPDVVTVDSDDSNTNITVSSRSRSRASSRSRTLDGQGRKTKKVASKSRSRKSHSRSHRSSHRSSRNHSSRSRRSRSTGSTRSDRSSRSSGSNSRRSDRDRLETAFNNISMISPTQSPASGAEKMTSTPKKRLDSLLKTAPLNHARKAYNARNEGNITPQGMFPRPSQRDPSIDRNRIRRVSFGSSDSQQSQNDSSSRNRSVSANPGSSRLDDVGSSHRSRSASMGATRGSSRNVSARRSLYCDRDHSHSRTSSQPPQPHTIDIQCDLELPVSIRSTQEAVVDPESQTVTVTATVVLISANLTEEERNYETARLYDVYPAICNVEKMSENRRDQESSEQMVRIGKRVIMIARSSVMKRVPEDRPIKTADVREYNKVCKASVPNCDPSLTNYLSIHCANGTDCEKDVFKKKEVLVLHFTPRTPESGMDLDKKTLFASKFVREERPHQDKRLSKFDEKFYSTRTSIEIERDTVIDTRFDNVWNIQRKTHAEEKNIYDYNRCPHDGTLQPLPPRLQPLPPRCPPEVKKEVPVSPHGLNNGTQFEFSKKVVFKAKINGEMCKLTCNWQIVSDQNQLEMEPHRVVFDDKTLWEKSQNWSQTSAHVATSQARTIAARSPQPKEKKEVSVTPPGNGTKFEFSKKLVLEAMINGKIYKLRCNWNLVSDQNQLEMEPHRVVFDEKTLWEKSQDWSQTSAHVATSQARTIAARSQQPKEKKEVSVTPPGNGTKFEFSKKLVLEAMINGKIYKMTRKWKIFSDQNQLEMEPHRVVFDEKTLWEKSQDWSQTSAHVATSQARTIAARSQQPKEKKEVSVTPPGNGTKFEFSKKVVLEAMINGKIYKLRCNWDLVSDQNQLEMEPHRVVFDDKTLWEKSPLGPRRRLVPDVGPRCHQPGPYDRGSAEREEVKDRQDGSDCRLNEGE